MMNAASSTLLVRASMLALMAAAIPTTAPAQQSLVGTWGGMNQFNTWVEVQITQEDDDTVTGTTCYIYANGVIQVIPLRENATRKKADTLNVRYQNNRMTFKITDWATREATSKLKTGNTSRTTTLLPREQAYCAHRMLEAPVDEARWTSGDLTAWSTEAKQLGVTLEIEIAQPSDGPVTARACGRDHKTGAMRVFDIDAQRALRPERTPDGDLAITMIWVDGGLNRSQYSVLDDGRLRWKVERITRKGKRKSGIDLTLDPGVHEDGCLRWTSALASDEPGPAQALPSP